MFRFVVLTVEFEILIFGSFVFFSTMHWLFHAAVTASHSFNSLEVTITSCIGVTFQCHGEWKAIAHQRVGEKKASEASIPIHIWMDVDNLKEQTARERQRTCKNALALASSFVVTINSDLD